ncbi:MAG: hypothetical protein IRY94_03720 [Rhodospirillaceae bacterium]|nr:hypothetical protein [Rhodospirillaceae bacterium]
MKRLALLATAAIAAWAASDTLAWAQSPGSLRNPYAAVQPALSLGSQQSGYAAAPSIRDPNAGTLAPAWLDSSSITDPKAGTVTPEGFAKYSSLSAAIAPEPVVTGPTGPLEYTLPPPRAPIPTYYNSYGSPFTPYQAPTNAFSTPYTVYTDPYVIRPAPAGYGSVQIPATVEPAKEAAAAIATGQYLPRPTTGDSWRMGSNR